MIWRWFVASVAVSKPSKIVLVAVMPKFVRSLGNRASILARVFLSSICSLSERCEITSSSVYNRPLPSLRSGLDIKSTNAMNSSNVKAVKVGMLVNSSVE